MLEVGQLDLLSLEALSQDLDFLRLLLVLLRQSSYLALELLLCAFALLLLLCQLVLHLAELGILNSQQLGELLDSFALLLAVLIVPVLVLKPLLQIALLLFQFDDLVVHLLHPLLEVLGLVLEAHPGFFCLVVNFLQLFLPLLGVLGVRLNLLQ